MIRREAAAEGNSPPTVTTGTDRSLVTTSAAPNVPLAAPICSPYGKPGMCIVAASFYPDGKFNNVFHVFDGFCNLDSNSKKSLDTHDTSATHDWSITGKPMPLPFDVMQWNNASNLESGFRWQYGSDYPEFSEYMPPPRVGEPGGPIMVVTQRQCYDAAAASKKGTCYAVAFECDSGLTKTWKASLSSNLPQPTARMT
ncbi:MAG: hypothetical protein Q9227_001291 [Pyrenula ochraceoflavens]